MNEKINLDPGAAQVLDGLHRAGYKAYLVGGCVRDSLAGRTPHDWDICTSARPEQTMAAFGESTASPPGCSTAPSPSGRAGAFMK